MVYKLMKRILERGNYDGVDMQKKLDVYLAFNRITQEQYEELCTFIQEEEGERKG